VVDKVLAAAVDKVLATSCGWPTARPWRRDSSPPAHDAAGYARAVVRPGAEWQDGDLGPAAERGGLVMAALRPLLWLLVMAALLPAVAAKVRLLRRTLAQRSPPLPTSWARCRMSSL
jgi:hypothetical protein